MKKGYIIGAIIIVTFAIFGFKSFNNSLTQYVTIEEAMKSKSSVQVKGEVVKEKTSFNKKTNELDFYIRDENGTEMKVTYNGTKPGNFDQASHAVVTGKYDGTEFRADSLYVKCPSKYQGASQ